MRTGPPPSPLLDLRRNALWAVASGAACALMFPPWELWLLGPVALVLVWSLCASPKTRRAAASD